jgi:hypothetical protein
LIKSQVQEIKKAVSIKNQEIGDYIDKRDQDIDYFASELKELIK